MRTIRSILQPFVAALLTVAFIGMQVSFGLLVAPKPARAAASKVFNTTIADIAAHIKHAVLDVFAVQTADRLQAVYMRSMMEWARRGFKGSPQFVENPERFVQNLMRTAELDHTLNFMASKLCYPFGARSSATPPTIQSAAIPGYPALKCTIRTQNLQGFFDDFTQGGWDTWGELAKPSNNIYGILAMSSDFKSSKSAQKVQQGQNEYVAAGGFLGVKQCGLNMVFSGKIFGKDFTEQKCAQYKDVTPGSTVGAKISKALHLDQEKRKEVKFLADLIAVAIDGLLNRFIGTKFMCLSCSGSAPPPATNVPVKQGSGTGSACTMDSDCTSDMRCEKSGSACQCVASTRPATGDICF